MSPIGSPGGRVADLGEELEVTVGVAGLALGDRAEQRGDVGVALDVGLLGELQVAAVGLALAGERLLQVLVGLGAVEVSHGVVSLMLVIGDVVGGWTGDQAAPTQVAQVPWNTMVVELAVKPSSPAATSWSAPST